MNAFIISALRSLSPALALSPDDDGTVEQPLDDPLRVQAEMQAKETTDMLTRVVLAGTAAHMENVKLVKACADRDEKVARLQELGAPLRVPVHHQHFLSVQAVAGPTLSADAASRSLEAWRVAARSPADDPADTALDLCDSGATFVSTSF